MNKVLNFLLIVGLIVVALWVKDKFFPTVKTVTETTTVMDTIWQDSIVYKQLPAPEPDTILQTDTVIEYKDSVNYFNEYRYLYALYNRRNVYNRVLKDDSSAYIRVEDTVHRNKLQRSSLMYRDRSPTIINQTTVKKIYRQRELYIGGEVGNQVAQPEVIYQDLNGYQYSIGYDMIGPEQGLRFGFKASVFSGF